MSYHRCSFDDLNTKQSNPNILFGALVGGPDKLDQFNDDRTDYRQNEVALDYNAGFQVFIVALWFINCVLDLLLG